MKIISSLKTKTTPTHRFAHGFTLIELSVVLVIIALIVGGILAGQSLIKSSQLRQAVKTVEQINTAVNTFKDKYGCLPGDCNTATTVFPVRSDCNPGNNTSVHEVYTCNGNGDGAIGAGTAYNDTKMAETYLFWQHLADAGLVPGVYTGKGGPGGYIDPEITLNVLPLGIRQGVVEVFYYNSFEQSSQSILFSGTPSSDFLGKHLIELGVNYGNNLARNGDFVFSANEAKNIDLKMDDGNGISGIVRATTRPTVCQSSTGTYNSSDSLSGMQAGQVGCALYIKSTF